MKALFRIERLLGLAVRDELDSGEKSATADIANVWMPIKSRVQRAKEVRTSAANSIEQTFLLDDLLDGERGCRGDRMPDVRVSVLECAAAIAQRLHNPLMRQHRADRLIPTAEPLRDGDEIGHNALLLDSVERPGATHSAHHFI